jgi:Lon-like ATP-dependent protease
MKEEDARMDYIGSILILINLFFTIVIGLYFWNLLQSQNSNKSFIDRDSRKEIEKLARLRAIGLTQPLTEKTRPSSLKEIVGQEEGLKALKAVLCGPNPQHVIIYGPPGVGKTAAARAVLEEAKVSKHSPFNQSAKFVEIDATTARFDERGIADPLIGSVHDPIYQGAGPMGVAGIPQPKPGAVTRAHGGILFIDEIGELHPIQMNKLLKVLEDRKVFFESAYYNPEDSNIPRHIHDIFSNGLPADFRLVGATTRMPHEIPPAIRSRCIEIFFRNLMPEEIATIAQNAADKAGFFLQDGGLEIIKRYACNGREAVNMVQIAAGVALTEGHNEILTSHIEWVVNSGQYVPRPDKKIAPIPQVGLANGLAIYGPNVGFLIDIEVVATPAKDKRGRVITTGVIEEEEMGAPGKTLRRKSTAVDSIENVLTVLKGCLMLDPSDYNIHVNFPGGIPLDGPSAGAALVTAIYSAIIGLPVNNLVAITGEVSIRGLVRPVGGIVAKIEAARRGGAGKVLIPSENWQELFTEMNDVEIVPVDTIEEVISHAILNAPETRIAK